MIYGSNCPEDITSILSNFQMPCNISCKFEHNDVYIKYAYKYGDQ